MKIFKCFKFLTKNIQIYALYVVENGTRKLKKKTANLCTKQNRREMYQVTTLGLVHYNIYVNTAYNMLISYNSRRNRDVGIDFLAFAAAQCRGKKRIGLSPAIGPNRNAPNASRES